MTSKKDILKQEEEKRAALKADILLEVETFDSDGYYRPEQREETANRILQLIRQKMELEVAHVPNKIDEALEEFYNPNSSLDMSEKMSNLRNAFMQSALDSIREINMKGTRTLERTETIFKQTEGMKQFAILEKMYEAQLKSAKAEGKSTEDINNQWLKDIKKEKSTIGNIVRNMNDQHN